MYPSNHGLDEDGVDVQKTYGHRPEVMLLEGNENSHTAYKFYTSFCLQVLQRFFLKSHGNTRALRNVPQKI